MLKKIKGFIVHPLFSGSMVMIVGSNIANLIAYIYHLMIGRLLGPSAYGELSTTISILGLVFATFSFIGLVIVKFISASKTSEYGVVLEWFRRKAMKFSLGVSLLMLLISPVLSNFLHIHVSVFIVLSLVFFFATIGIVYKSFLQGMLHFKDVVIANNLDVGGRLVLGILFVYLGWSVLGAVIGIVLAIALSYFYLETVVKKFRNTNIHKDFTEVGKVIKYSIPVVVVSFATNSLMSSDLILVKHYFSAHDAGIYASLSTLGRIIFYGAGPVGAVMFPMISQRYSQKEKFTKIFYLSFLMTFSISALVVIIYKILPSLSIEILYGKAYLEGVNYLFWIGVFMGLFTLTSLMLNLYLSIDKTKIVYISVVAAIFQVVGIIFFHNTIFNVIFVSILATVFMLIVLIGYFIFDILKKS